MSGFIPENFGQVVFEMEFVSGPSNPMACVFGYEFTGDPDPSTHAGVLGDLWEDFISLGSRFCNNLLFTAAKTLENPGGVSGLATYAALGTRTGTALPPQVAALARKNSLTGGRRGRGRTYLPGLEITQTTEGGFLVSAQQGALQGGIESVRTGAASAGLPLVILHDDGGLTIPSGITSFEVQAILATQRRRIRG